jgi:hypothetical protein
MIVTGGLLAIVIIAFFFLVDGMAKSAVESSASTALGVPTTVADLDLGVFSGECGMGRVVVKNPPGYRADHLLSIGSITAAVSLRSLLEDTVVLPELILRQADMNLEQNGAKSNYGAVLGNVSRAETPSEAEKKFVIRRLSVEGVVVHVNARVPGMAKAARADVTIPRIDLENVGTGGDGVRISEIAVIVLRTILAEVAKRGGVDIPAGALSDLGGLLERIGK